ncbi:hypothetical protein U1Q18_027803, partial [Sarracenia purpurea var. burkii]
MVNASAAGVITTADKEQQQKQRREEKRPVSIFNVPSELFDSSHLLQSPTSFPDTSETPSISAIKTLGGEISDDERCSVATKDSISRWSCNTCKAEFESLQGQRAHLKSDIHRFNIRLTIAGKDTGREEDFDELTSDSLFEDYDISNISGSEDEVEKESLPPNDVHGRLSRSGKQKLFICPHGGERVSIWKCSLLDKAENVLFKNDKLFAVYDGGFMHCLREKEVIEKLKLLIHEPRDNTHLRVVLLASGGHFAGCVLDGNSVVPQKMQVEENEVFSTSTPLHEAAKSGDAQKVLELLEQGFDPRINDELGRTPYILTIEKEVRDAFRRFMASNLDKWDWRAAKVPSALTKEMEESQAAKRADKDAKPTRMIRWNDP